MLTCPADSADDLIYKTYTAHFAHHNTSMFEILLSYFYHTMKTTAALRALIFQIFCKPKDYTGLQRGGKGQEGSWTGLCNIWMSPKSRIDKHFKKGQDE